MPADKPLKEQILDAAAGILMRDGAKRLTQPEVARALGIRQSHLTYYFPHRADLLMAIAERFVTLASAKLGAHDRAGGGRDLLARIAALHGLITPPAGMRAFVGLVVEADQDPAVRAMLSRHFADLDALVARQLGRDPGDPDVSLLLEALRGLGLRNLLHGRPSPAREAAALARRLGFLPPEATRTARRGGAATRKRPAAKTRQTPRKTEQPARRTKQRSRKPR